MKRAVALGKHQRALLIEASAGLTPISKSPLDKEVIRRRRAAAEGLVRLDLARRCITQSPHSARGVSAIELTAIGHALVRDFASELASGERMRWGAKGWQTVPASEGPFGAEPTHPPANDPGSIAEPLPASSAPRASSVWTALQVAAALLLSRAA